MMDTSTHRSTSVARPRRARSARAPGHLSTFGSYDIPGLGQREVRVFLPPGYVGGSRAHPLLIMLDGQNVFGDEGSFAGGWHAHEAVSRRARSGRVTPVILGIHHGGGMRLRELSPWTPAGDSLAEPFLDFVVNTLVPQAYRQLRLNPGPQGMTIAGSSLGGLAALWAHFRRPDVFANVIAMSPSLFVGRGAIFRFVAEQSRPWSTRIWLDAGGQEAGGRMLTLAARMANDLRARGWGPSDLAWRPVKTHRHSEQHWRRRFPRALRFIYG